MQISLDLLLCYCNKWKLFVNTSKTKVMIFRKAGRLHANVEFQFGEQKLEIVSKFAYLGLVFTTG